VRLYLTVLACSWLGYGLAYLVLRRLARGRRDLSGHVGEDGEGEG
jgi:hypothetical protein